MRERKTTSLQSLVDEVNERNRNSTCAPATRNGWSDVLEWTLMRANAYKGFRYLRKHEVPEGEKPGINDLEYGIDYPGLLGISDEDHEKMFANTDESRRHYFI